MRNKTSFIKFSSIISVVSIIAIIFTAAVCFVACNNQKDFEKRLKDKGYSVESVLPDGLDEYMEDEVDGVEWALMGAKESSLQEDFVLVLKFKDESSTKDAEELLIKNAVSEGLSVKRIKKIILLGTEQAVKDAQ